MTRLSISLLLVCAALTQNGCRTLEHKNGSTTHFVPRWDGKDRVGIVHSAIVHQPLLPKATSSQAAYLEARLHRNHVASLSLMVRPTPGNGNAHVHAFDTQGNHLRTRIQNLFDPISQATPSKAPAKSSDPAKTAEAATTTPATPATPATTPATTTTTTPASSATPPPLPTAGAPKQVALPSQLPTLVISLDPSDVFSNPSREIKVSIQSNTGSGTVQIPAREVKAFIKRVEQETQTSTPFDPPSLVDPPASSSNKNPVPMTKSK